MRQTQTAPRGRDEEFREFMRDRASPLHQSAYLLCGDWHLAHDLVQETLVKAYQHWPRVRRADSPDAYVRRILVNEVRGRWRRRKGTVPAARFADVTEPAVPDATEEIARRAGLLQALLTLPLRQRATVVLRYLEGMSERETALALGCSEGTVKSQSSRALATLRTYLDRTESRL
jgi:RNA polymerase sigma-70 factor (sigma-E family)